MYGFEIVVFMGSIVLSFFGFVMYYVPLMKVWPVERNFKERYILGFMPFIWTIIIFWS